MYAFCGKSGKVNVIPAVCCFQFWNNFHYCSRGPREFSDERPRNRVVFTRAKSVHCNKDLSLFVEQLFCAEYNALSAISTSDLWFQMNRNATVFEYVNAYSKQKQSAEQWRVWQKHNILVFICLFLLSFARDFASTVCRHFAKIFAQNSYSSSTSTQQIVLENAYGLLSFRNAQRKEYKRANGFTYCYTSVFSVNWRPLNLRGIKRP